MVSDIMHMGLWGCDSIQAARPGSSYKLRVYTCIYIIIAISSAYYYDHKLARLSA